MVSFHTHAVPPTVVPRSKEPLIGVETRDGSPSQISIEFAITRADPGVQPENITWTYRSEEETMAQEMEIADTFNQYEFSDDLVTLTLFNLSFFDAGFFTLRAANEAGMHSATLELVIHGECLTAMSACTNPLSYSTLP